MILNSTDKRRRRRSGRLGPKISDVGVLAGVSVMTVSRVLNGGKVRASTRDKVLSAITELGFVPNSDARSLRSQGEAISIGILYSRYSNRYLGQILYGCVSGAGLWGVKISPIFVHYDDEFTLSDEVFDDFDGVILVPPLGSDQKICEMIDRSGCLAVVLGASCLDSFISIEIDAFAAAVDLTSHLLALGHRRIGFIGCHRDHLDTELKRNGFSSALTRAGIVSERQLIADDLMGYGSGFEVTEKFLQSASPPSAIVASTDELAIAALTAAHERGCDVPADLSVCGFGDVVDEGQFWPGLTTIRTPFFEMAQAAVEILAEYSGGNRSVASTVKRKLFPHVLVRRQSDCAPRRRSHP